MIWLEIKISDLISRERIIDAADRKSNVFQGIRVLQSCRIINCQAVALELKLIYSGNRLGGSAVDRKHVLGTSSPAFGISESSISETELGSHSA